MTPAGHATIVMVLFARGHPAIKPPPPETFTETVAEGDPEVGSKGPSFTRQAPTTRHFYTSGPQGSSALLCRVAIKDGEAVLTQVADEYGNKDFFDLDDRLPSNGYGEKRNVFVETRKASLFLIQSARWRTWMDIDPAKPEIDH
jgi:hypothetical protein